MYYLHMNDLDVLCQEEIQYIVNCMINSKDIEIKRIIAFNLPCFYYVLEEQIDFFPVIEAFLKEDDTTLKKSIASGIHEIFSLASKK